MPGRLRLVTVQLDGALRHLRSRLPTNTSNSGEWFNILTARVVNVSNTLTLAMENYDGVAASKHTKRGLADGIGQLSRTFLGTAMQECVEDLRDRYNYLTSVATAQNKAITLNCKHIARLDQQMHDIVNYTNVLTASLSIWMRHKGFIFPIRPQSGFVSFRVYCKFSPAC